MDPARENNPLHHAKKLNVQMAVLVGHLRSDVVKVREPKAQALFEASAEVITDLIKAFDDYQAKCEAAWRTTSGTPRGKQRVPVAKR